MRPQQPEQLKAIKLLQEEQGNDYEAFLSLIYIIAGAVLLLRNYYNDIRGLSMSKLVKMFLILALAAVVFSAPAEARGGHGGGGHHGGGWHGGGWHGGGWRGGGWGGGYWGPYLYYQPYYQPYYYGPGDCGWVRVRVLRRGYWVVRRAWRCW